MTKQKTDAIMKRLGKLIASHDGFCSYDLNEKFYPALLDLGFIEAKRSSFPFMSGVVDCFEMFPTITGRHEYLKWLEGK